MTKSIQGRGASFNPGNRFEKLQVDDLSEEMEQPYTEKIETHYYRDSTRSILAKNDSPDVPFTYSVNPYRGCEHGCIYCFARPTHEYLGFSSGLDFESKIMVKLDAAALLEEALRSPSFEPQVIALSGNTDCYQPVERKLKLTRAVMEVFLKFKNPFCIITKNSLVLRDIDLLQELSKWNLVSITVSVTTLDQKIASVMEPRTSSIENRLKTIKALADANIPVGVNAAPLIPGLTDLEMPEILKRAADNGAKHAGYTIVRLPHAIKDLFKDWLHREFPTKADKVLNRITEMRGGKLYDSTFGKRMRGEGEFASAIDALFDACCRKYHLNEDDSDLSTEYFQRPGQLTLFG